MGGNMTAKRRKSTKPQRRKRTISPSQRTNMQDGKRRQSNADFVAQLQAEMFGQPKAAPKRRGIVEAVDD